MKTAVFSMRIFARFSRLFAFKAIVLGMLLPSALLAWQGNARAETSDDDDEPTLEVRSRFDRDRLAKNYANPTINTCYRLDWSYDKPKELPRKLMSLNNVNHFRPYHPYPYPGPFPYPYPYPMPREDVYTWYCQARPVGDTKFEYSSFHSYDQNRLNARTFAISRCREDYDRCTARCALAPRVCEPHFWP